MSSSSSHTNSKRATAGYVVAVFRRLFCSTTLPTYHPPSDHHHQQLSMSTTCHTHTTNVDLNHHKDNPQLLPPHPGLMARLMGLETMPPPTSITRSRSMNSVEPPRQCDPKQQHRRVMSSVSFRELPMFLEQEDNDEFFVISFERSNSTSKHRKIKDQETRKKVSIEKKNMISMVAYDDKPTTSTTQCEVNYSTHPHPTMKNTEKSDQKEISNAEKSSRRKMMTKSKHSIETGSEDSSPVSVFDFEEFVFDLEEDVPISSSATEVEYPKKGTNSRRKLSLEVENYDQPTMTVKEKESRRKGDGRNKKKNVNKWKQICELAYEDIMEETNWMYNKDIGKLEVIEDISAGFEIEILHHLLNEMAAAPQLNLELA